jgi:hypothetical protein
VIILDHCGPEVTSNSLHWLVCSYEIKNLDYRSFMYCKGPLWPKNPDAKLGFDLVTSQFGGRIHR